MPNGTSAVRHKYLAFWPSQIRKSEQNASADRTNAVKSVLYLHFEPCGKRQTADRFVRLKTNTYVDDRRRGVKMFHEMVDTMIHL